MVRMRDGKPDDTRVSPLSRESASAVVAELADRAGLPAPRIRWHKGSVSTLGVRGTFVLGHDLRTDPDRFPAVVGHFVGHVGVRNLRLSATLTLVTELWFAMSMGIASAFLMFGPGSSVWLRLPACLLLPIFNAIFLAAMERLRRHLVERQADAWAADKGVPSFREQESAGMSTYGYGCGACNYHSK